MNIEYIKNEIVPKREQEIKEDKNRSTSLPIYAVMDLREVVMSSHSDFNPNTNCKEKPIEFGYIEEVDGERAFTLNETDEPVTRLWLDDFVAFFLTSEGAHEYLKYQSHNLSSEAYVFVFHAGYRNREMEQALQIDLPFETI